MIIKLFVPYFFFKFQTKLAKRGSYNDSCRAKNVRLHLSLSIIYPFFNKKSLTSHKLTFCFCPRSVFSIILYVGMCCFIGVWTSRLSFHCMVVCVVLLVFGHQGCRFIIWWFVLFCWRLDINAVVSLYGRLCCFVGVWTSMLSFHYMVVCVILLVFGHQGCRFLELL